MAPGLVTLRQQAAALVSEFFPIGFLLKRSGQVRLHFADGATAGSHLRHDSDRTLRRHPDVRWLRLINYVVPAAEFTPAVASLALTIRISSSAAFSPK